MLSTNAENVIKVSRRIGLEKYLVPSPCCSEKYDKNMGDIDLDINVGNILQYQENNQSGGIYLFSFIFHNACIVYLTLNYPQPKNPQQLYDFK